MFSDQGDRLPTIESAGVRGVIDRSEVDVARSDRNLHTQRWTELPELGSPVMLRVIHWIAVSVGRKVARLFLYPITFYFVLTAHRARRASYDYFRRLRGSPAKWRDVFGHFYCFAATILDRVYLLRGEFHHFVVSLHNKELLHDQVRSGQGCILLGSHLGSFEVLRTLGITRAEFPLKVLMDVRHNQNITRFLDQLNPQIAGSVIVPDQPDTLLKVKESLDAGFLIGTLGDRPTSDGKVTQCRFLGAPTTFPAGPVLLAGMMRCPIILFFGLYRGSNRYELYFERLSSELILNREQRAKDIQYWTQRYVDRLEHYTRLAPDNWFNFYPFWD